MFRYGRVKKRFFVVLFLCVLAVTLPVALLFFWLTTVSGKEEKADFLIGELSEREVSLGTGLNLTSLRSANLLQNAAFEPLVYRRELQLSAGGNASLLIQESEQEGAEGELPLDQFFQGANIRILRPKANGLQLLKESRIQTVRPERLSAFHEQILPPDMPRQLRWTCLASQKQITVYGGSEGYILVGSPTTELKLLSLAEKADVVAITVFDEQFLLLNKQGSLFLSSEGEQWERLPLELPGEEVRGLCALPAGAAKPAFVVIGTRGKLWFSEGDALQALQLPLAVDLWDCLATEQGFYVCGAKETLFHSPDGLNWQRLYGGMYGGTWRSIASYKQQILLAGTGASCAIFSSGGALSRYCEPSQLRDLLQKENARYQDRPDLKDFELDFTKAIFVSEQHLLLSSKQGGLLLSEDGGASFHLLEHEYSTRQRLLGKTANGFVVSTGDFCSLYYAQSGREVVLAAALEEGSFRRGDVAQIEKLAALPAPTVQATPPVLPGEWFISEQLQAEIDFAAVSAQGGRACLCLTTPAGASAGAGSALSPLTSAESGAELRLRGIYSGQTYQIPAPEEGRRAYKLVQRLSAEVQEQMRPQNAFRLDFWAKAESAQAQVSLSLQGFTFPVEPVKRRIDQEWRKYSALFFLPGGASSPKGEAWLNVDILTEGKIYFDQFSLLRAEEESGLASELRQYQQTPAQTVRLAFLAIGQEHLASEYWLTREQITQFSEQNASLSLVQSFSLAETLGVLAQMSANPWFVLTPGTTESELRHLCQYLFGSSSSEYGKLRASQGSLALWNERFSRLYFEMADMEGRLTHDQQKAAFVDWAIAVIVSTPEYKQVKNELVFVDGMQYSEGVLLSKADCHAADFPPLTQFKTKAALELGTELFGEALPRDPSRPLAKRPELQRSLTASPGAELRVAEVLAVLLDGMGKDVVLTLFNASSLSPEQGKAILDLSVGLSGLSPLVVQRHQAAVLEPKLEQQDDDGLCCYAFEGANDLLVYALNLSNESRVFEVSGRSLQGASLRSYEATGSLLEEKTLGRGKVITTILPGGVCVLRQSK